MKILALLLTLITSLPLRAAVISSIERLDSIIEPSRETTLTHNFAGFGPVWSDHTFTFRTVPNYLIGGDLVRTSYRDHDDADFQLRVTLDAAATLFLLIDNRAPDVATTMPWVAALGFTDTGDDAVIAVSPSSNLTTSSIYSGIFPAGDVVLLQQNAPGNVGMYLVAAVPEPASLSLLLFGSLICLRRHSLRPNERNG